VTNFSWELSINRRKIYMARKVAVPASAIDVAEAKRAVNVDATVPIGGGAEVYVKPGGAGRAGAGGRIVIRGEHVKPSHKLGSKAKAMKACAGKKGCEFEKCLQDGGITPPRSIRKACSL
jgi:hypothetical protein